MSVSLKGVKFSVFVLILQIVFIVIIGIFGRYEANDQYPEVYEPDSPRAADVNYVKYPNFMDVNGMIFVGFGFLMTFLKSYSFSAVGFNMLLSVVFIQWAAIVRGFIHADILGGDKFHMGVVEMVTYLFGTATALISFGAVLGKTSPIQLLVMGIVEILLAQLNEYIGVDLLHVRDIGESMFIHMFGAYFGLAVARVLFTEEIHNSKNEGSVYHSDVFAMIGTIFLWIFWPSFNGGFADDQQQRDRAYLNTFLSLCACTVMTFAVSALVDKRGRFNMVHVQNSSLAGGVVVGATANMPMEPFGALICGAVAGTVSVLGYKFLTPLMAKYLKIHDTCGVHNLHGMPGVIAAAISAILAAMSDSWSLHDRQAIFPETFAENSTIEGALGRTAGQQGGYQFLAATITLGIAIGGGVLTGFILKIPIWNAPRDGEDMFNDSINWEVPEVEPSIKSHTKSAHTPEETYMLEAKDKLLSGHAKIPLQQ